MIPKHFQLSFQPLAHPDAVVSAPHVRFTVLTSQLLRLEYSPTNRFEDRPSQTFWYRQQPVPPFKVERTSDQVVIDTGQLRLVYRMTTRGFAPGTLSIEVKATGKRWRYGDTHDWKNLGGTARTLDGANGPLPLERGLVSQDGWAVVDDSHSLIFDDQGWLEARGEPDCLDLYFFGYGHDYRQCIGDFCRVAGPAPLIPRYILGNWWSRYWAYTQTELTQLMQDFKQHEMPLSVCIVDMDWHMTNTGNDSSGWTGYTWNRELFPDPAGFLAGLHEQGLRTALNLHPADGVYPHEEQYEQMAQAMGVDPSTEQPIEFDMADPRFMPAYFDVLHHPYEELGVDFWWLDWQQGTRSKLQGLDPLLGLNHFHFYDLGRDGSKRPLVFSRWFGLGNHRYPIGFSGDTVVSWESLAFQPYFTATAANVAFGWWSHDIGGHMQGIEDGELYARWVQFGVFSPILRLHSTNNPYQDRRPWAFDDSILRAIRQALQLRHQFIPYLYTMAWRNHTTGLPLITPLYYEQPDHEFAYLCPQEYTFGTELIAAPFTTPIDPATRLSRQQVWLPAGEWFNFFTGDHYRGDGWITVYGSLDEIPVFARAGAIVPLAPPVGWGGVDNPRTLEIHVFPFRDQRFELYEDDGITTAYQHGRYGLTAFDMQAHDDGVDFTIEPGQGDRSVVPPQRTYRLIFQRVTAPDRVRVTVNDVEREAVASYEADTQTVTIEVAGIAPADRVELALRCVKRSWQDYADRRALRCRQMLRVFRLHVDDKQGIDERLERVLENPNLLKMLGAHGTAAHLEALRSVIECEEL